MTQTTALLSGACELEVYLVVTAMYLAMCLAFHGVFAAIDRALFGRWRTV